MKQDYERFGLEVPAEAYIGQERLIQWRDPHDRETNDRYDQLTAIDCEAAGDKGKTLQAPAEEQDINVIMKRFGVTDGSILPYWRDPNALYGDFSEMPTDPVEAAELIRLGELTFMTLPADLRQRWGTGAKLYNWLSDEKNHEEARKLGLLDPKQTPPSPIKVEMVSSSTSSDKE